MRRKILHSNENLDKKLRKTRNETKTFAAHTRRNLQKGWFFFSSQKATFFQFVFLEAHHKFEAKILWSRWSRNIRERKKIVTEKVGVDFLNDFFSWSDDRKNVWIKVAKLTKVYQTNSRYLIILSKQGSSNRQTRNIHDNSEWTLATSAELVTLESIIANQLK